MIDRTLIIFTLSFFSSLFNHSWASFAPVPVDAMKVTCKTVTGTSFDVTAEPSTSVRSRRAGQRRKILTKRERLKRNASLCSQKKKKKKHRNKKQSSSSILFLSLSADLCRPCAHRGSQTGALRGHADRHPSGQGERKREREKEGKVVLRHQERERDSDRPAR